MIDERAVRQLSESEQHQLMRLLVRLESERLPPAGRRSVRWDIALVVIMFCCLGLAAWTGWLAATLPHYYRTGTWRGAWVGFDIGLLAVFAATGWAAWRRRQLLIISLVILATLLVCDAWFDVVLDVESRQVWFSVASALLVELPLAALAALMARRLLRLSIGRIMSYEGAPGPVPPLRKIPLLGPGPGLRRRLISGPQAGPRSERGGAVHGAAPSQSAGAGPEDGGQRHADVRVPELEPRGEEPDRLDPRPGE
jgi:hypothetical protein